MPQHHHHPVFCAIPPHMIEEIINRGTTSQANKARRTLTLAGQMRGQRQSLSDISRKPEAVIGHKQRQVFDAQYGSDLPGRLIRSEGEPPVTDDAANEAYDGAGATYDLYFEVFERNSIDNNGMPLISIVHYLQGYDNAFWDGGQMVYGDGDEDLPEADRLFNRFTSSIDIMGHELTHGVTQYEAKLAYYGQSGALNESFSDIFGILVKQRNANQTVDETDWLIGAELLTVNVTGNGIRSMKAPGTAYDDPVLGKDPQPAHMKDFVNTIKDNGGVHINSGIPNKAFYETAMEMGGFAWEKTGKIWYITLRDKLKATSDFQEAAEATYSVAQEMFGNHSEECQAVANGWESVGISIETAKKRSCLGWFINIFKGKK